MPKRSQKRLPDVGTQPGAGGDPQAMVAVGGGRRLAQR